MNPKKSSELNGVRLAFAQAGALGTVAQLARPSITAFVLADSNQREILVNIMLRFRRSRPRTAHSQIVMTRQLTSCSSFIALRSFLRFRWIFLRQKPRFVAGHLNRRHLWPCQKHP